jgi:hypothetical protein
MDSSMIKDFDLSGARKVLYKTLLRSLSTNKYCIEAVVQEDNAGEIGCGSTA